MESTTSPQYELFTVDSGASDNDYFQLGFRADRLYIAGYSTFFKITSAFYRDTSAWYHVVVSADTNNATAGDRLKIYVNGVRVESFDTSNDPSAADLGVNRTANHKIGQEGGANYFDGYMSQVYLVDGQALDASYFGFTDPLTNTWRPKKYTGTFGTNGFYLPMDGNSLIGEDKSGNGNDWTPVNFGGSNSIEKATGALPILNTTNGGRVATVGVRTDTAVAGVGTCLLALPLNGNSNDVSHLVDSKGTERTITVSGPSPTLVESNFYGASYSFDGSNDRLHFNVTNNGPFFLQTDFTMECWAKIASGQTDDRYFLQLASGASTNSDGCWSFRINSSKFEGIFVNGGTQVKTISANNYVADKWTHIAYVREGN